MGEIEARRLAAVRLNRLLNRRVLRKKRCGGRGADTRRGQRALELGNDVGQRPTEPVEEEYRVQRFPSGNAVFPQQSELERQLVARHLVDVGVDSVAISAEELGRLRGRIEHPQLALRGPRDCQSAHLAVERKRGRAGDLGEPAARGHRLQPELKEPVAGNDVPQGAIRVVLARRKDVWHAAPVIPDLDRRAERRQQGACLVR